MTGWVRAAVVSAEEDGTREQSLAEQTTQLLLVPALPPLLLRDERSLVLRLRATLLAAEDLLRAVELDGLAVDGFVERRDPEDRILLRLAPAPGLLDRGLELLRLGKHEMDVDVALLDFAAVQEEPALNGLTSKKTCDGWGRQSSATVSA